MTTTSLKVADNLYLVKHEVQTAGPHKHATSNAEIPTNQIVVLDCSGSMWNESPKLRQQLKNKLPGLMGPKDTLTVIWFSGRGEAGILFEGEPIATLKDLSDVNKQIDRWIKPMGLTGFKDPLVLAGQAAERLNKKISGSVSSLFFCSDGYDNCSVRSELPTLVGNISKHFAAATFVEYGYYADRPLLTQLAEKAGGQLIFSDSFEKYEPAFQSALQKKASGAKKLAVEVEGDPINGFAYAVKGNDLITFAVESGKIDVPEDIGAVFYLNPKKVGTAHTGAVDLDMGNAIYAAKSLFAGRMQSNVLLSLLKLTGDVYFIDSFSKCFGKDRYSDFMAEAKAAAFDPKKRLTKGFDPKKIPADDAYTILDLLELLQSDDDNRVLLHHEEFKVSRISRARQDASEVLTDEEQEKLAELTKKLAKEKNAKKIAALQEDISKLTAGKESLKFETTPSPNGYSISNLVFSEDRPNINILIRMEGTVDISGRLPAEFKGKVPEKFPTFRFRNYPVVADGLVHMEKLPVRVTRATADKLAKLLPEDAKPSKMVVSDEYVEGVINLRALPVINRKMVKEVSAKELFEKQFELEKARAAQKVYKDFLAGKQPKKESASFKTAYGEEAAEWLKEQGFTDYSGFSPKMVVAESTDHYIGKALEVKLKGYSSLPSMGDFRKQAAKQKYNGPGALMKPFVEECEAQLASFKKDEDFIAWVSKKSKESIAESRKLILEMAKAKFSIVVGQIWPKEFKDLSENSMTLKIDKTDLDFSLNMRDLEVKI